MTRDTLLLVPGRFARHLVGPGRAVRLTLLLTAAFSCSLGGHPRPASAHFPWLAPAAGDGASRRADLYFSESAHPDDVYASVRRDATLALEVPTRHAAPSERGAAEATVLPDCPQSLTSFGGAVAGDSLYVYGGHTGEAHSYSSEEQSNLMWRLNLRAPGDWETVARGPSLQGLGLVSHQGLLYRIGGFTAKNAKGQEHDLHSVADVARFDPGTNSWHQMSALPEPRSSHDAAVVGDTLFVVGGWQLRGKEETRWHDTAWSLDLSMPGAGWQPVADLPQRRALAAAAFAGRLYVLGGMQRAGGPTTRVDVYDPTARKWSQGPSLCGEAMAGFGCSAFATAGGLYVSTSQGDLQRLAQDGSKWEVVRQLKTARFFHRMLPVREGRLVIVGGANMDSGKFRAVDVVDVP